MADLYYRGCCQRSEFEQATAVLPRDLAEYLRLRQPLQRHKRLPRDAFSGQTRRRPRRCLTSGTALTRRGGAVPVQAAAVAAEYQLVLMPGKKARGKFRIAGQKVIARVRRHIRIKVRVIAQEPISDAARLDAPSWIGCVFGVIRADVRPERIGVPDEFRVWKRFQHDVELLHTSVVGPWACRLIDFLKMNRDRHVQLRRERVEPPHLWTRRFYLRLDFAQPHRAVPYRVAQPGHGIRLCYIDAGKPDEAVGIRRSNLLRVILRVNVR